jgi:hypothetical protein
MVLVVLDVLDHRSLLPSLAWMSRVSSDTYFPYFAIIPIHLIRLPRLQNTLTRPTIPTPDRSECNLFEIEIKIEAKVVRHVYMMNCIGDMRLRLIEICSVTHL